MVRGGRCPLAQIVRRIGERQQRTSMSRKEMKMGVSRQHFCGPLPQNKSTCPQYRYYYAPGHLVSNTKGNNCFMYNGNIVLVRNILVDLNSSTYAIVEPFNKKDLLFDYPLPSSSLGIYVMSDLSRNLIVIPIEELGEKLVMLPHDGKYVGLPMLHK